MGCDAQLLETQIGIENVRGIARENVKGVETNCLGECLGEYWGNAQSLGRITCSGHVCHHR